jgi:P4 family phage/plasmid primase-like protien
MGHEMTTEMGPTPQDPTSSGPSEPEDVVRLAIDRVKHGMSRHRVATEFVAPALQFICESLIDATPYMLRYQADVEYLKAEPFTAREAMNALLWHFDRDPISATYPTTEQGDSWRLIDANRDDFLYAHELGWVWWDSRRWATDTGGLRIQEAGKHMYLFVKEEAARARERGNKDLADRLEKHATVVQRSGRIGSAIKLARSDPHVIAKAADFDSKPAVLNFPNGTLDLLADQFRDHDRADRLTIVMDVPYLPEATCPNWEANIQRFWPNLAVQGFLKRLAGYTLLGKSTERIVPVLHGEGDNFKSTFMNVLFKILGPNYCYWVDPEKIMTKNRSNREYTLAALRGKRLVVANETDRGDAINEGLLKILGSHDAIEARSIFGSPFNFLPTHVLWILTNNLPDIKHGDEAVWGRIVPIPCTVRIPREEQVPDYEERVLMPEASGILNWLIEGAREYLATGLGALPSELVAARAEYRGSQQEQLKEFLDDWYDYVPDGGPVATGAILRALHVWCQNNDETPEFGEKQVRALGQAIRSLKLSGVESTGKNKVTIDGQQTRGWYGLKPKPLQANPPGITVESASGS